MISLALGLPVTDPVLIFAIAMVIILIVPIIFERLRVPGLVGLILTGAVVGPSMLGILERTQVFILLGAVGLLYLMFMAGLSLDLRQFAKLKTRSITFGLFSFFIPQMLALAGTMTLLGYDLPTALLIGSVVGSHTLLAYPIVQRLGIVKNTAITMTMGGTMVTDVLSLTILAVVVAAATGDIGPAFWVQFVGLVSTYVAAVWFIFPRMGEWFFKKFRQPEIEFVFLMALLFSGAWLAEAVGLAAIIGAFLIGIVMNSLVPAKSPLMTRISFVGNALFIPFFLLSVGMLVDIQVLLQGLEVWLIAGLFVAFILIGKLVAAKIVQRIYSYSPAEGWAVYGLSTPQAAATLAVTLIGFEIGLLDTVVVNAVVVVILVTTLLGPWLVEKFGEIVVKEEEEKPFEREPSQRILVPMANPKTSDELMQLALFLHSTESEQPIYPLTVTKDEPGAEEHVANAEKVLGHAVVYGASADVPVTPIIRIAQDITSGIQRAIKEERISTVVVGWDGKITDPEAIFGSVLDPLLVRSKEMIIITRVAQPVNTTKRLILAVPPLTELEPGFEGACRAMKIFAEQTGADLVLVTTNERESEVMNRLRDVRPEVDASPIGLSSWDKFVPLLQTVVRENDMIVLMSVREGAISWQSSLDDLPQRISTTFPENNFLTTYLSEVPISTLVRQVLSSPERRSRVFEAVRPELTTINLPDGTVSDVLTYLIEKGLKREQDLEDHFDDRTTENVGVDGEDAEYLPKVGRLDVPAVVDDLQRSDTEYVPEVIPGLVLYHSHTNQVDALHLFVGVHPNGLEVPRVANAVHVIMVLLVPQELDATEYLHKLTVVSQLVRSQEMIESLCRSQSDEEAHQKLLDHVREQDRMQTGEHQPMPGEIGSIRTDN